MTIDDFIEKVDVLTKAVETEMPGVADELALNAIALIKNRIVDKREGIGASYSTKPMLATKNQFIVKSAFKQTIIPAEGKRKKHGLWIKFPHAGKAVPVMELPQGYKQFREIQGRQGNVVDLSFSGKMWQGVTIVARSNDGKRFITVIGGSNQEAQNKLSWMTDKYGPFLITTPDENDKLNEVFNNRMQNLINQTLQ